MVATGSIRACVPDEGGIDGALRWLKTGSKRDNGQIRDFLKVAQVGGEYGVTLFNRGGCDHQIIERQHVSFGCFLSLDLANQPSGLTGYRMDRNQADQFLNEQSPGL